MFRLDGRGRLPALILSGGLAATLGLTAAPPAQAATSLGTVTFAAGRGALAVTGTSSADTIAFIRSSSDGVDLLGVDLDGDGKPETLVPQALVKSVAVDGRGGNDRLSTVEIPATIRTRVAGGAGNDTMLGGPGAERFDGGPGDDSVFGGRGDDLAYLGSGNDRFGWAPGDGNDTVEGQAGRDTQLFLGAGADENVTISNVRGRVRFFRDVGNITMNLNDVEVLDTDLVGGNDTINVRDLSGTDVKLVINRLGNNRGNQGRTIVDGTRRADRVTVAARTGADGTTALVRGLPAAVELIGAGVEDELVLRTGAGNDRITSTIPAGALTFTADGGTGDDTILGGDAAETLRGGSGSDVIDGGRGDDVAELGDGRLDQFIWDPGDGSDRVDGGPGADVLIFRGSAQDERFEASRTGRNESLFTRDVGNIRMALRAVEAVDLAAMGGADALNVGDLTGSGLQAVVANLSGVPGSRASDGAIDTVTVEGTDRADAVRIAGRAASAVGSGRVQVAGLPAEITLSRVEPTDRLIINGRGGDDTFDARRLRPGTVELTTVQ